MMPSSTDQYVFSISGFSGFEAEVLRLRNANRPVAQSPEYLDWRYSGAKRTREPKVFWIRDRNGRAVGMASLIFRHFWMGDALREIAVLGDISLDADLRGGGLGRSLLKFMSDELQRNDPDCLAFVMPNRAAQKVLASIGWSTVEKLIPYVFVLNPELKLRRLLRSPWLAKTIARPMGRLMTGAAGLRRKRGYSLDVNGELDGSFETLWRKLDKADIVLSDRGVGALTWRYARHPHCAFRFGKLDRHGNLAGYLVYELAQTTRECTIYDLILLERKDLGCMLALLAEHMAGQGDIDSIRLLFNERHPYRTELWKLGYLAREEAGVFQLLKPETQAVSGASTWFLTYGDKDI